MRTVFCTHCSDDWYEPVGCYKLEQSLHRLYPRIPFVRFGTADIEEQRRIHPGLHWDIMIPVWGKLLSADYDLVVHLDADSIVTGPLDELLAGDYEVAGVRNNDDFGHLQISCLGVSADKYLNCGLVAATNPAFWTEWDLANFAAAHLYPLAEQDVFNQIVVSDRYRFKLLDPPQAGYYYGVAAHPTQWQQIVLRDGRLHLHGKEVKILHQAVGHHLPKLQLHGQFQPDVARWLFRRTNSPCVRDATGAFRGLGHDLFLDAYLDPANYLPEVIRSMANPHLVRRLQPSDVIIDVGAHMGVFSVVVSPIARRVVACEPHNEFRQVLEGTVAHGQAKNVEICPCALWTSSGEATMFLNEKNRTMHSLVAPANEGAERRIVETLSLSDLLHRYQVGTVDLLKLDIEGAELALVLCDSFVRACSRVKAIWVECHPVPASGLSAEEVTQRVAVQLASQGLRVEQFGVDIYAQRGENAS